MSNGEVKTPRTVCAGMWGHGPLVLGAEAAGKDRTGKKSYRGPFGKVLVWWVGEWCSECDDFG
jgi:hypothetical protein